MTLCQYYILSYSYGKLLHVIIYLTSIYFKRPSEQTCNPFGAVDHHNFGLWTTDFLLLFKL